MTRTTAVRRAAALLAATAALAGAAAPAHAAAPPDGTEDAVAAVYHDALLRNTRFVESTWKPELGSYPITDYLFVATFGNAVLLRFGDYDAEAAGVSREVLEDHTIRSIAYAAAQNRYANPAGTWGGAVYWDAALEAYFVAGAKLLWDRLDEPTRRDVDAIVAGSADNIVRLGADASTNGLRGGFRGDTKLEEMGNRTMPLAAALAYLPDDPRAASWREWLDRWTTNMTGLPAADEANPALVDGTPISAWNEAQNLFDTFIVENHGTFAPHYHQAFAAYAGRDAAQFLIGGQPVPEVLERVPNGEELEATLRELTTDSGVPAHVMIADRHHLYGRDVLPLTYLAMVQGDRYAAAAERMLASRLGPYVAYPPEHRLTKFSGEPKYEPEARSEVAMAYLLHRWRDRLRGDVAPVSEAEYFQHASGTTDHGAEVGLVSHQSPRSLAAAVTKAGYVKFAFLPGHDDWLFDVSGTHAAFLPSTATSVTARSAHVYERVRDGFDATATALRTPAGVAGYTTLPSGRVVYATSGLAADEGRLTVYDLDMPGVPGLDGDRTFTGAAGAVTLAASDSGDGGVDRLALPAGTEGRYVRMRGARTASQYGYSIFELEVRGPGSDADLALGRPTTASSDFGAAYVPPRATDGDPATRWAVSGPGRQDPGSWIAVDLGERRALASVEIAWADPAYASAYAVQVSDDGQTWRDVAAVPDTRTLEGPWLNVDGRAGFVVRGAANPIRVAADGVVLAAGPAAGAAGMVVEGRPPETPEQTAEAAARPQPSGGPDALRAHVDDDGYLSLFNLAATPVEHAELAVPQPGAVRLYRGTQRTADGGVRLDVSLAAADAAVEAPRFVLRERHGGAVPAGLRVDVADSRTVRVANEGGDGVAQLTLVSLAGGDEAQVTVPPGHEKSVSLGSGPVTPTADLARGRTTFPTSPLPDGMSDPDLAVDADPSTAWRAGSGGRMVVDLGAERELAGARLLWDGPAPAHELEVSDDGLTWTTAATAAGGAPRAAHELSGGWRYVAVELGAAAALAELEIDGR